MQLMYTFPINFVSTGVSGVQIYAFLQETQGLNFQLQPGCLEAFRTAAIGVSPHSVCCETLWCRVNVSGMMDNLQIVRVLVKYQEKLLQWPATEAWGNHGLFAKAATSFCRW